MKERPSLSKEIAKAIRYSVIISLVLALAVFFLVLTLKEDLAPSLVWAIAAAFVSLLVLLALLPKYTAKKIADKVNAINLNAPFTEETFAELDCLIQKAQTSKKETAKKLEDMSKLHTEQDKMRRDFTANVSHELKTPLTSIKGYSELIRDGFAKKEDVPRFAEKIHDEAERLITLVGDIIKLSQLDGNDVSVKLEKIDLYELTSAVVSHLEMAASEKNITVELVGDKPVITGGEQVVEEMIFNLVDNAIKYNRDGGKVKIKLRQRIDGVELEVSDTGIGIAEEDIPHIFERFWRADKSHSKEIGGTGLGLSIVKHGAMFMDARVSVKSKLNEGTTIRILF